jgi:hypothetical protein
MIEEEKYKKFREILCEDDYNKFLMLRKKFSYLSFLIYNDDLYYGIIQKSTKEFLSIYLYTEIKDHKARILFLKIGENWWWESNRKFPINFFYTKWDLLFRKTLKNFSWNGIVCYDGPLFYIEQIKTKSKIISLY